VCVNNEACCEWNQTHRIKLPNFGIQAWNSVLDQEAIHAVGPFRSHGDFNPIQEPRESLLFQASCKQRRAVVSAWVR